MAEVIEEWRAVPGWEGLYEVSSEGRVRGVDRMVERYFGLVQWRGRVLRPYLTGARRRYPTVTLRDASSERVQKKAKVHVLVALAFFGPRPPGLQACHANDEETDNRLTNLRYDTRSANVIEGFRNRGHINRTSDEKRRYDQQYHVANRATILARKRRNRATKMSSGVVRAA